MHAHRFFFLHSFLPEDDNQLDGHQRNQDSGSEKAQKHALVLEDSSLMHGKWVAAHAGVSPLVYVSPGYASKMLCQDGLVTLRCRDEAAVVLPLRCLQ